MSSQERKDIENKIEALVIAIPKEKEAHDFYMKLHEEYTDTSSKEMFLFLATQEIKHQERLEQLLADLEQKLLELK
jgi:rubrerythrin